MNLTARQQDALVRMKAASREIEIATATMQDAFVELQLAAAELGVAVKIVVKGTNLASAATDYKEAALEAITRARRP